NGRECVRDHGNSMQQPTPWQSAWQNPSPLGPLSTPTYWYRRLLRPRRERPCRRAAQRDELAPLHSITSSAMASTPGGIVRSSVLAVLRLITSSYLVGACTGRSAGFAPLRMRST